MAKKLIRRTEFAKLADVTGAYVTKLCAKKLKAATDGKMIDVTHPDAAAYLKSRGVKAPKPHVRGTAAAQKKRQSQSVDESYAPIDIDENIAPYADMTLREILTRFGTQPAFEAWLNSAKKLEEIREKRLKNAVAEGEVIERELVSKHVIGFIDANNERLLSDAPKTIVGRIVSGVKSKRTEEELESEVTKILGDQTKLVKTKVLRSIRSA